MKTDTQLQKDVMEKTNWKLCVTAAQIEVSVANGVVTLNGTVPSYTEKWAAELTPQRIQTLRIEVSSRPVSPSARASRSSSRALG